MHTHTGTKQEYQESSLHLSNLLARKVSGGFTRAGSLSSKAIPGWYTHEKINHGFEINVSGENITFLKTKNGSSNSANEIRIQHVRNRCQIWFMDVHGNGAQKIGQIPIGQSSTLQSEPLLLVAFLFLVVRPGATSSFLLRPLLLVPKMNGASVGSCAVPPSLCACMIKNDLFVHDHEDHLSQHSCEGQKRMERSAAGHPSLTAPVNMKHPLTS